MKISEKDYAMIILRAAEKNVDAKQLAPDLWQSLYQSKSLGKLNSIISLAEKMLREKNNQLLVRISSATKLSDEQIQDIQIELKSRFHKEIITDCSLDPSLGSGLVVTIDDKIIDLSGQHQIDSLIKHINQ